MKTEMRSDGCRSRLQRKPNSKNMKITGITAEYDPFHRGHLYQLKRAGEMTGADGTVVVLGGDFLQRGTPCTVPKALRARMAADSGADLVLQLPYIYSVNSSSEYTRGAVSILDGIGCVDCISFGCETDDTELLKRASMASSDNEKLAPHIREFLSRGMPYAEAMTLAAETVFGTEVSEVLRKPNNLLACGYMAALRELGSDIEPVPVLRMGGSERGAYEDDDTERKEDAYLSASSIRKLLTSGRKEDALSYLPPAAARVLVGCFPGGAENAAGRAREADRNMLQLLRYRIMTAGRGDLAAVYTAAEGIEARAAASALACGVRGMDGFIGSMKTKRYTWSRISRLLVHMLMNFTSDDFAELRGVRYARVLAFSDVGREILSVMRKTSDIPVISNLAGLSKYDARVRKSLELDIRAAGLYDMIHGGEDITGGEYRFVPYRR